MLENNLKKDKHVPVRMCLSCRKRDNKKNLLRIVKVKGEKESEIKVDTKQKLAGRGVYLCYDLSCLKKLKKIKPKNRGFLSKMEESVYNEIEVAINGLDIKDAIESVTNKQKYVSKKQGFVKTKQTESTES